jgi:hypothetical protein
MRNSEFANLFQPTRNAEHSSSIPHSEFHIPNFLPRDLLMVEHQLRLAGIDVTAVVRHGQLIL